MSYSFTGVSIALVIYLVFSLVAFGLAYYASTLLATVPTIALNATIAANNKTAASLLVAGAWVSLLPLLLVLIFGLIVVFTSTDNKPFSRWYYFMFIFALIALIVAIVLIGLGIGYIDSSTANAKSADARIYALVAGILLILCMFPIFYMWYAIYRYNNSLVPMLNANTNNIVNVSLNENYPGQLLDATITVDGTVLNDVNTAMINGKIVQSNTAPKKQEIKDVFKYKNGVEVIKEKPNEKDIIYQDNQYVKDNKGVVRLNNVKNNNNMRKGVQLYYQSQPGEYTPLTEGVNYKGYQLYTINSNGTPVKFP